MQSNAPDEEHIDPHGECAHQIGLLRIALENLADACDCVGVKHFDTDTMDPEVTAMQEATLEARTILRRGI